MEPSGEDDDLLDGLAAIRPDQTDAFARSLQASVRRSLVGASAEPFRLGRFTVLELLGGGGMGVVFVAYDPDLDRKIALKVLHSRGDRGRRDVLREGRALARLKHPNVVAVYEVGELDDDVFVAMEYVEGHNLREWLREPRAPEAILARLIEAGRGLAAAHAVDLVHRDFKPENLVIDAHGTARVIDFGLARSIEDLPGTGRSVVAAPATAASMHGGTPAYMAPERLAGGAGDRRSDQYSFCVTCWEALFGVRPTGEAPSTARASQGRSAPGWLRRVLERGLERDPARRWPSMTALLGALERGRTRARLWRAAAVLAGVAALGAAAEGVRRRDIARRVAACEAAGAEIDAAWDDDARQRLRAAFVATGVPHAAETAARVIPRLDEQTAAWKRARTDACLNAEVRERWSEDTSRRAVFCLEDRQMELASLAAEYGRADATAVLKAVPAVAGLRTTDHCMDEGLLQRQPAPPERGQEAIREVRVELSRAVSLGLTGNFKGALEATTRARARAGEAIDWPPLWAAARAQESKFLDQTGAYEQAEAAGTEAYFAAARAGAWAVAAEAATKLIFVVGHRRTRHADGRAWARHAELAIVHAGDWSGLAESSRLNNLALVSVDAGAYAEARALHERALAIREEALGPAHPDVAASLSNLALVDDALGAYDEARALHERVLALWEQALGPDHPYIAASLNNLAVVHEATGAYDEARALHERALAIREKALGPGSPEVADSLSNLANVHHVTGAYAEARELSGRALAIREKALGPDHCEVADSLSNLAMMHTIVGGYAEARALQERALAIREKALGPDHPDVASSLHNLADLHRTAGARDEARALHERVLAIREKTLGPDHPEVAWSLNNLGYLRHNTGEYAEARALHERALAIQERALGPDHPDVAMSLTNLGDVLLAEHRPQDALPLLERAVAIVDAHPGAQEGEFETHFALARALVATRGDRARALAEAREARDGLREAGEAHAEILAEVERWLAENDAGE